MTVANETASADYTGDGATTSFAVPFRFLDNAHVQLTLTYGVATVLTEGVDYTLTGAGGSAGTAVLTTAPPADATLAIRRSVPLTQSVALTTYGPFSPATLERALDKSTMQAQQVLQAGVDLHTDVTAELASTSSAMATLQAYEAAQRQLLRDELAANPDAAVLDLRTVRATGTTTARTLADRFAETLNVLDFGADPTGVADSTTAIQNAINASLVSNTDPATTYRTAKKAVFLPPGKYKITSGIKVWSIEGAHVYGAGRQVSKLYVSGAAVDIAFDVNGCGRGRFHGFGVQGFSNADTFNTGIEYRRLGVAGNATCCGFEDVMVSDGKFKYGIRVGNETATGAQEDQSQWRDIYVVGQSTAAAPDATWWRAGVVVGAGIFSNNLIHSFYGYTIAHFNVGVQCSAGQAAWYGGNCQSNAIDWQLNSTTSYWKVSGVRSEDSGRFIQHTGGSSAAANVSFEDCQWRIEATSINADKKVIDWGEPGCLYLQNIQITGGENPGTIKPFLNFQGCNVFINGLTIGGGATLADWLVTPGNTGTRVMYFGVCVLATSGAVTASSAGWNIDGFDSGGEVGFGYQGSAPLVKLKRAPLSANVNILELLAADGVRLLSHTGPRLNAGSSTPSSDPSGAGYSVGDIRFNTAPTAGGKVGWVCITAGNPGTWKPFGDIDA